MSEPQPPDPIVEPTVRVPVAAPPPVAGPTEEELAALRFRKAVAPAGSQAVRTGRALKAVPAPAPAAGLGSARSLESAPRPANRPAGLRPSAPAVPRPPFQPRRLHEDEIPHAAPVRFGLFTVLLGLLGFIFRVGLASAIILAIAFAGGYYLAMSYIRQDEVVVPSVRGMKVESAFETLSDKNLAVVRERTEASALVAPGEIIEQRPAPGIKTKRGSTVRLVISSGRANFVVPNVVGESRENAINKIRGARFEVGNVLALEDDLVPRDYVISQTPEAGKGMDFAGRIDLAISAGPRGTGKAMPLVSGKSIAEARTVLAVAGVSEIATEPENAPANAVVTSQEPPAGAMLTVASRVVLRVNP